MLRINNSSRSPSLLTTPVADERTAVEQNVIGQIVEKAQASAAKEENSAAVLAAIVTHVETLIDSGNVRSPHMPVLLQEALVVFIRCNKEAGDFSILRDDILFALDALIAQLPEEHANALKRYKDADLRALLAIGIQLYNKHQPGLAQPVTLDLKENVLQFVPPEIQFYHYTFLSLRDQLNLSLTCKQQNAINNQYWTDRLTEEGKALITTECPAKKLFLDNPKYRLPPYLLYDQLGIDYLQKDLGVDCGPLTIQKIKNGELTIEQAKQETTDAEKRATILGDLIEVRNEYLRNNPDEYTNVEWSTWGLDPFVKYMVDGTLTKEDFNRFLDWENLTHILFFLNDKAIQKYLDNQILDVDELYNLAAQNHYDVLDRALPAFNNSTVQKYLDNGKLTLQRPSWDDGDGKLMIIYFNEGLASPGILKYLQNSQLTLELLIDFIKLTEGDFPRVCQILECPSAQVSLDRDKLTMEQLLNLLVKIRDFDSDFILKLPRALEKKGVQKYLESGELTMRSLITAINIHAFAEALDDKWIQTYLDNKELTIKLLAHLPNIAEFTQALQNYNVRDFLAKRWITIEQLTKVPNITAFVKVLDIVDYSWRYQGDIREQSTQKLINLPDIGAFRDVIAHPTVEAFYKSGQISHLQLMNLPNLVELARALYNKNVHKLLIDGRLPILQLIKLPNISAFVDALSHQQVRAKLKRNELTIEQLVDSPNITELVNSILASSMSVSTFCL